MSQALLVYLVNDGGWMLPSWMWSLAIAGAADFERVAVVIGANAAPPGRATLRYAHDDAERVARTLVEVGGLSRDAVTVLNDPSPREVLDTLAALPSADVLLFFYSGHADDQRLFPAGAPLAIDDLQAALEATPADLRVGVLDACRGGGWTGTKGVVPAPSFPIPSPSPQQGTVYLAASSGGEDAHEAEIVGGSFFTHHWTSGLRGPADADADGRVTLDESFAYARAQTIRDSTVYTGEPQHPSFRVDLRGRDPVVLSDLRDHRSTLSLHWTQGPVTVHALENGTRLALPHRDEGYRLALPPGPWMVRRESPSGVDIVEVELEAGVPARVTEDDLTPVGDTGLLASKGDEPRGTDRMAPSRGQWMIQAAIGSASMNGSPRNLLVSEESYVFGLTDRLSLRIAAPALGMRIGRLEGPEMVTNLGFLSGGFGYSNLEHLLVAGELGGSIDGRLPTSPRFALQSSFSVAGRFLASTRNGPRTEPVWAQLALGLAWRIGRDVTIHPGVVYGAPVDNGETFVFGFGSTLSRNTRSLPLVQVSLSNSVTLDGHFEVQFDARQDGSNQTGLVGLTYASRTRKRSRQEPSNP